MAINREPATPPPMIGKIGPYTVFVTPPPTPKPSSEPSIASSVSGSPMRKSVSPPPVAKSAPPVLPPPVQYEKSASAYDSTKFGFFWDAVAKVQNAHSSLDEYVARWFGLNQSKYQWALDDYYEKNGVVSFCGSFFYDLLSTIWLTK
ncbi:hypothetical protein OSB04_014831 [Centaurea solstitialis]|uniref:Hydroxyproline-rich glycoprotein family protein n=1 Tax=Centaurea solstitialis TaxID=347529 RepID=A0AA38TB85_9ASTR|nr:hypothetical protein OSB04_014831 [Centaurea solstitialis]